MYRPKNLDFNLKIEKMIFMSSVQDAVVMWRLAVTNGLVGRVFTNSPGDWGSISGQVIPKTKKKMVLDATLFNIQHYKETDQG